MKSLLLQVLEPYRDKDRIFRVNILKEFIQETILYYLSRKGYMGKLIFEGGTCLRFMYGLRRFSEDLDFSVKERLDYPRFFEEIQKELELQGYEVEMKVKGSGNIKRCFYKFPELLNFCGITSQKGEKLSVLVEIDSNPPSGGELEETIFNRNYIFTVVHYSLPSLMAKKLHTILFKGFVKGRDYFDLIWLLSKGVKPDIELLNNAKKQTGSSLPEFTSENWKALLWKHIEKMDMKRIKRDLMPFLENPEDAALIEKKNFYKLLK